MTNFDFLKNFNNELYEIGIKLEEDVINSPRAVTADATLFLENLVKDIYRLSNKKLEKNLISFYKKIDNLYRSGAINYIYKSKLQDAYNLRNKIHKKNLDLAEEKSLALDLHKRLFYISKKYFRDYCENERYIEIPDYKKPKKVEIRFDNCIICGSSNKNSISNMCKTCNQKIENANFMLSMQNTFKDSPFTRNDLIELGISESHAIILLMDLSKYDAITNKGNYYILNPENFNNYLSEIDKYIEIGLLITKFYTDEITTYEIKESEEYNQGKDGKKPYRELYRLVNLKIEKTFEENLISLNDLDKSIKNSSIDETSLKDWYYREKDAFNEGILNDAFILYNEIQINKFFKLKKKMQLSDHEILKELKISNDIFHFWQKEFMGGEFFKKTKKIKKDVILKELKNHKSLDASLKTAKVDKKDFNKMYDNSKENNGEFYQNFNRDYTEKRKKLLLKHLKNHNLNKAIRLSKIKKSEFLKWYYEGEKVFSEFYFKTTKLLMDKYLSYRKNDWDKKDILKEINVSREMFNSWLRHDEFEIFREFESRNNEITTFLVKRGMIINAIKDGKGKEEAIFSANMTPMEFMEIYNNSKKEKTEFYLRFDLEYEKSRKKRFSKLIKKENFYYTIQKCEISQKEFSRWYAKDQDHFLATNNASAFYLTATTELMDKYLKARYEGKNKPDAAKSVGLTNIDINKWLKHPEFDLFYEFKRKNKQMKIDLIVDGFKQAKSKLEVSEIYDIPLKSINKYIDLGKNGFIKYEELFELYENNVIPTHLKVFLNDFKTKTLNKSLKHAKLSSDEINHYYYLGKSGDDKFSQFYRDFLSLKIDKYVKSILSRKSQKIALKNSNLSKEEFGEIKDDINEIILRERICIIGERILKNKTTGVKLAKAAGISVDEFYDWYFKGKDGDEKYKDFSKILDFGVIYPRVIAYRHAQIAGVPEKWLNKKLKKDLGSVDYNIWLKHDLLNLKIEDIDESIDIDDEMVEKFLKNSSIASKVLPANKMSLVRVTVRDKNEATGK